LRTIEVENRPPSNKPLAHSSGQRSMRRELSILHISTNQLQPDPTIIQTQQKPDFILLRLCAVFVLSSSSQPGDTISPDLLRAGNRRTCSPSVLTGAKVRRADALSWSDARAQ